MMRSAEGAARRAQAHLPELASLLGLLVYIAQSLAYARTTISSLDEGGYLYKGLLFATGIYEPFQPYGVWTNKMPMAFLIPGYAQTVFGAGLQTGRLLAVLAGALAVAGTWIVARRLSGRWWAAAAVWVLALSPVTIKYYSNGVSQPLIACMLAWTLVLALGENRRLWHLIAAGALSALTILTRQNMVVVLPLLVLYIAWQHGLRQAAAAAAAGVAVLLLVHLNYWPAIMQIWLPWLPRGLSPSLSALYVSGGGEAIWTPSVDVTGRILSAFQGTRVHFYALAGGALALIGWPQRSRWQDAGRFRAAVFLGALFLGFLFMHAFASLSQDYCVYCFAPYVAFFVISGILFVTLVVSGWSYRWPRASVILTGLLIVVVCAGIGFSLAEDIGKWVIDLPAPRIREGRLVGGLVTWYDLLSNKFGVNLHQAQRLGAAAAGTAAGIALIVTHSLLRPLRQRYPASLAVLFLAVGTASSPILAGRLGAQDCPNDVMLANQAVGGDLARYIQSGATTYWNGGLSVAPLLYAPDVRIYPPQINSAYSYLRGGNTDLLLRAGLWNNELDYRWRAEADYIIIEEQRYMAWKSFLDTDAFVELPRTTSSTSCLEGTRLRIFKRAR